LGYVDGVYDEQGEHHEQQIGVGNVEPKEEDMAPTTRFQAGAKILSP
jgi:hypothetical protein